MLKLFYKDLKLFINDWRSLLLTFLLPIILISLFAFAYGGIGSYIGRNEPFQLLVTDNDGSEYSKEFVAGLDSLKELEITILDYDQSKRLVIEGKFAGAFVIHQGFQDSLLSGRDIPAELLFDRDQELEIGMVQSYLMNSLIAAVTSVELKTYNEALVLSQHTDPVGEPMLDLQGVKPGNHTESFLKMTSVVGERDDINLGLIQAVAGTAILMLLFSVAGIGTSLLEEKENGTIKRLLYSPLKKHTILFSKMLFAFFIATLQLSVMFLFSGLALNLDITVNPWALVLMILSTAFAVSSMGIFLAAIAKSRQQAQTLSTLIILVMSAIGGSMIPLFIMPDIMGKIAVISVNYWGIQGFYDIFWRTLPLSDILQEIIVLISIGLFVTVLSIRLFYINIVKLF